MKDAVSAVEIEYKESIMHYSDTGPQPFFKIITKSPKDVAGLRSIIQNGVNIKNHFELERHTYESNLPFTLRYMIDTGITGMCWVELPANRYEIVERRNKTSICQIEANIEYSRVVVHAPDGEWSKIAPMRVLSFDIECNTGDTFPTPDTNEVIQIGNVCKVPGSDTVLSRCIFTLKGCAEIVDAEVCSYETEREMFMAWMEYVKALDPDIITGFNILNFDFTYLWKRAEHLGLKKFHFFGRILNSRTRLKDTTFQSKAQGLRETKEVTMEGRIVLDMFQHVQREHKLSQYSLNSVSLHFLKEQKEDVHWTAIHSLQEESDETRRRIAIYCLKDCYLPLRLLEKLMCVYNYTEMARVTGVPFTYLLTRGQQIKVASQLYRKAKEHGMLIPTHGKIGMESGEKYEGAYVLDPVTGFYTMPIATLDFASLYPSIMMAHNLCYCTLLPPHVAKTMDSSTYLQTPSGDYFVKPELRKGLLPMILEELLSARKRAREELKRTEDPFMQKVLEGRQLALKISANSVYGFTGAQVGQLPCISISQSVTSYGRMMIEQTKNAVEGYEYDSGIQGNVQVLYGDTDSVMVKFGVESISEAMILGKKMAEHVTKQFQKPIRLEFEKVYCPYLLMNKKRYAGLLWTNPDRFDKIDAKGIESVRRDNCALVRDTINMSLELLLIQKDKDRAIAYVKDVVSALLQNQIDISMLVITKALGKKTATNDTRSKNTYTAKQAHVELAEKMHQRDANSAPSVGDRIAYVMIKGVKGQKAYELAEDPIYVLQNNLPLDFDYYLEKQLKGPLSRLYEPVVSNVSTLFTGEHTRKRYQPKITSGAMAKFIVVSTSCMKCRAVMKTNDPLCERCEDNAGELVTEKALEMYSKERMFQELWSECQRCQGSFCQEVLCSNRDCPIFYRREKVRKELGSVQEDLARLRLDWF